MDFLQVPSRYKRLKRMLFSDNHNNKLNNIYFTTVRKHNSYKLGEVVVVQTPRSKKTIGFLAKIIKIETFTVDQMNDFISYLDYGTPSHVFKMFLKRTYGNSKLDLILLENYPD